MGAFKRSNLGSRITCGAHLDDGRPHTELAKLNDYLAQVKAETRRVVFVSWEPAIGKTTLVRAFLDSLAADRTVRIGRGQCVEQYGAGEPYMLMPETLTRLCRSPTVSSYRRFCIGWRQPELAQMPSLVSAEDRFRLQTLAQGTTQQRIMR